MRVSVDVRGLMRQAAQHYADREALVAGETRLTFAEAWRRGCRMANALLDLGLKPGDRIGVLDENSLGAADCVLGATIANVARVSLYARNSREAHAHMLGHTGCRILLVDEHLADSVGGIVDDVPSLERVVVRDVGYEDWLAGFSDVDPDVPVRSEDLYAIRHTGGTSGWPKGVPFTHRSWIDMSTQVYFHMPPVRAGDRYLHVAPISHGSGFHFLPIWASGGSNVMGRGFDPEAVLQTIERERIGYIFLVPTMLAAVVNLAGIDQYDLSSLKAVVIAGAPTSDDTLLRAHQVFGDTLFHGYGQTEVNYVTMMTADEWFSVVPGSNPLRSVGRALPMAQIEVIDDDGKRVPIGEIGEIALKTPSQLTEFWEAPEVTAERIVDSWVRTNDVGFVDANGYLYITDRKDDMIISGGFNIWPRELERVIESLPGILEVTVFGVPDERWGESPLAVCRLEPGTQLIAEDVIEACRAELGSYKKPSAVTLFYDPLPRTSVGKIDRKALREPYWAGHDRRVAGN
jgi:acyl-CoA synthetase (AMP-forming)/AMP-acid ligase II